MENKTPGFEERSAQDKDSIVKTTGKKMASKTASKQEGNRITIVIFKRHRSR